MDAAVTGGASLRWGDILLEGRQFFVRLRKTSSRSASRVTTSTMPYPCAATAANTSPAFATSLR